MDKLELEGATIYVGDCVARLKEMPAASAQMCVTSPPYYGLRDYGHDGQIRLEETPEACIVKMVEVFREVRRMLADDGTLWVNIGDSYAGSGKEAWANKDGGQKEVYIPDPDSPQCKISKVPTGCKPKDLIGVPWMLAFALRADGWYLRQDIIWHKPNPMPESVRDRCTKAHGYLFLLSKSECYYYDHEAVKEPAVSEKPAGNKRHKYADAYNASDSEEHRTKVGLVALAGIEWEKRNRRSVWSIATKPYKGAHFATFPPALVIRALWRGAATAISCSIRSTAAVRRDKWRCNMDADI